MSTNQHLFKAAFFTQRSGALYATASSAAIAVAALAIPSIALAQNECGIAPVGGGTVVCAPAGTPFPGGVTYVSPVDDLTIVIEDGVVIDTAGALDAGLSVIGSGNADITVAGPVGTTITTSGAGAFGVLAASDSGALDISLNDIATSGVGANGLSATSNSGAVTVRSRDVTVGGDGSAAITATSAAGDVSIVTTGSVLATGAGAGGIFATSTTGDAEVVANNVSTISTSVADSASGRAAIFASGQNAAVTVTGSASTSGTGFGGANAATVAAIATGGNATATINNASASGAGVNAVQVVASNNAQANLTGAIRATGAGADAVVVTGGNLATVTVGSGAVISASDGDAIVLTSANGSTLNNAGVIGVNDAGFAIAAFGGPLRLNNTGTITSDIGFTGGADVVNNSGTFVVGPNPDFGAGVDVFANSGTVRFLGGATTPVTRVFTGLETFNNTGGLIDLRNGIVGDVLTLPGTFSGSGDSTVGLDASLSSATGSDRLVIGGAATGSTALLIDFQGPATLNSGTIVVQGGAGSQAGAFSLDSGSRNFGLIEADLVFDASANTFALVGAPSVAVYRIAGFADAARNLWYKSADTWSAHMRELRDGAWGSGAGSSGGGLWVQMHASRDSRDNVVETNNFGVARSFDLGFEQDYFGGQAGFDFGGSAGDDGNFAFGVTGGYVNSEVNFGGVTDRLAFDAFNGGAYATVNSGSLFLSVLGKYDYYKANSTSQIGQYAAKFKGDAYGAQAEVGFRLGSDKFFIEPIGTIAYVRTNLNDLEIQNSVVDFRNADGFRGKLGARLGTSIAGSGVNTVVLYAGGNFVHEFRDDDEIDFINGGQTIRIANQARGDYGEGVIGVNISATNMVSGFIEANGAKGSKFDAFGGRAGLRIRF